MNHRIVWPILGVLGLGLLVLGFNSLSARQPGGGGFGGFGGFGMGPPNRFVVAHATPSQVLILDTTTGQVYQAKSGDFKKMSELPRMGEFRPPFFGGEKDKESRPPFGKFKDKKAKDPDKDEDKDIEKGFDKKKDPDKEGKKEHDKGLDNDSGKQ